MINAGLKKTHNVARFNLRGTLYDTWSGDERNFAFALNLDYSCQWMVVFFPKELSNMFGTRGLLWYPEAPCIYTVSILLFIGRYLCQFAYSMFFVIGVNE